MDKYLKKADLEKACKTNNHDDLKKALLDFAKHVSNPQNSSGDPEEAYKFSSQSLEASVQ